MGELDLSKIDLSSTNVGKLGCSALGDFPDHPNINHRFLNLSSNRLDDAEAVALAWAMADNVSLKEVYLAENEDTSNYLLACSVWFTKQLGLLLESSTCQVT